MRVLAGCLLAVAAVGCAADDDRSATAAPATAAMTDVPCEPYGVGTGDVTPRDISIGPLTLIGGRNSASRRRNAFGGHGYKIPATLLAGKQATLSVPPRWRGKVGLIYTQADQRRAWERGVRGAPRAVRFTACASSEPGARSGWPGGIVVDRPRCATLVVRVAGELDEFRARVPLGRRCPRRS
ncbi:MAG TPA: hypothetical protein VHF88_10775 [Thermoleophilaceae bacterium]|nr:hypothetical protein [Thermoleophilaceae bacterium]